MGDLAVIYWESENPQRILEQMAQSQEQFDEWFRQFIQNTHGVDITGGDKLLGELPEGSSIRARFTFGCTPYWRKLLVRASSKISHLGDALPHQQY
jgi:hypothetical protein